MGMYKPKKVNIEKLKQYLKRQEDELVHNNKLEYKSKIQKNKIA
jgi:hypothetical protein|tara:strand:+ start:390 stop:521 length:132 start_codon:yes stop_codon:yes gene_type:complete